MKNIIIGVDVGGTNVKLGMVDGKGKIFSRSRFETKTYTSTTDGLIKAIASCAKGLIKKNGLSFKYVKALVVGLPGLIDPQKGQVIVLPNIAGWKNVSIRKKLQPLLGVPVFADNDANLIALGEWGFGAGKGAKNIVMMTLGTGVGAGLILNNELYCGPGFAAGELGHMPIHLKGRKCSCGSFACLEMFVGNKRLLPYAARLFGKKDIRLQDVFALAKNGNKKAIRFWEEMGDYIGAALVGIVNVLNPERIVIGGGVSNNQRFIFPAIRKQIKERCMPVQAKMVKIVRAKLGDDAGIIGARVLAENFLRKNDRG